MEKLKANHPCLVSVPSHWKEATLWVASFYFLEKILKI